MKLVMLQAVLEVLKEQGVLESLEIKATRQPHHGSCCCCQLCGYLYEHCVCKDNDLLQALNSIECFDSKTI